jgi:large subunit ribosomal protein L21
MFAILETGGKQYRVEEGDILEVELLSGNREKKQDKFVFENVLLLKGEKTLLGTPYVKNARVQAKVLSEIKAPKVIVFKKKSKKQYKKTKGHRQRLHKIQIEKIEVKAETTAKAKAETAPKAKPAAAPKAKPAPAAKAKTATAAKKKAAPAAKAKTAAPKKETK